MQSVYSRPTRPCYPITSNSVRLASPDGNLLKCDPRDSAKAHVAPDASSGLQSDARRFDIRI